MTILLIPTQVCKNRCKYCFERIDVRDPKDPIKLDVYAMQVTLQKMLSTERWKGSNLGMHGGECTHIPRSEFEALLKIQYDLTKESSIQTAGNYIQEWMIRLFQKYNTSVGISADGPAELNTLRGPAPGNEKISYTYNRTINNQIRKLLKEKVSVSVMAVLHTENVGTNEKLETFKEWLLELDSIGAKAGRLNPMYANAWTKEYELSNDRLGEVYCDLFDLIIEHGLRWNPLREMVDNLLGYGNSPCSFCGCDYYPAMTTAILPDGTIGQCDRTFQEGIVIQPEEEGVQGRRIRSEALHQTVCRDCDFWSLCLGGCPAEAEGDDWRNRTRFCQAYQTTYQHINKRLKNFLPNVYTILDNPNVWEPFGRLTWWGSTKPSHYGAAPHKEGAEIFKSEKRLAEEVLQGGGHGDREHGDKPHGDHIDDALVK